MAVDRILILAAGKTELTVERCLAVGAEPGLGLSIQ